MRRKGGYMLALKLTCTGKNGINNYFSTNINNISNSATIFLALE